MITTAANNRKIIATCALPYANGPIHIGHLVEYLQADFWTRFQKMRGVDCHYICADDTHGTPIMVEARKRGITPEQLIADAYQKHTKDFADFEIKFSHYSSTNSDENRKLCEYFFSQMKAKGHLRTDRINQLYCNHDKMFLPDRFVKGTCPKCSAPNQYGDSCDVCGATYSPTDLKNSYCAICSNHPVVKESEQLFFKLEDFNSFLKEWLPQHTSKEVSNKMLEWFKEPLRDWDISRNSPYFGFKIPGYDDKFFYVWVDAPMGYVSSTAEFCKLNNLKFEDYWQEQSPSEIYHFIGKDIVYFHTLFWPALLKTAGLKTPTQVFVHGHLMVNGEKMSKSKGTFISARTYLNHLEPLFLRYYYASKLSNTVDDLDLSIDDFIQRVNSELIGKITNLASRGAQMLGKKMDSVMSTPDAEGLALIKKAQLAGDQIAIHFENRDFAKGITEIRDLADAANKYFDEKAPWKTLEINPQQTKEVLTSTLNLFRILAIYLKPILPSYATKVEELFGETSFSWDSRNKLLTNHKIAPYQHLANRIEAEKVQKMIDDSKQMTAPTSNPTSTASTQPPAGTGENGIISIDDFGKVDLRIALITAAEEIKEADKLLRVTADLGPLGSRQIIAGIKSAYDPKNLIGKKVLVVANLAPRKMKFGISEGMILAAGAGGKDLFVLSPDEGAKPGDKVK